MKKLPAFAFIITLISFMAGFAQDINTRKTPKNCNEKEAAIKADGMMSGKMSGSKMEAGKIPDGPMKADRMKPNNK